MVFPEFLEFIGRLAYNKYRSAVELNLAQKIECILDEIFGSFNMLRNETVVVVEEVSESDDDY